MNAEFFCPLRLARLDGPWHFIKGPCWQETTSFTARWREEKSVVSAKGRLLAVLIVGGIVAAACATPAQASGSIASGSMCVADRSNGAHGMGHLGVGVLDVNSEYPLYHYGSIENPSGAPSVAPGDYNGGWTATGSYADMVSAFTQLGYDALQCTDVAGNPNVDAALADLNNFASQGYGLFGNNCEDGTYTVGTDYGVDLPNPASQMVPNDWFNSFSAFANAQFTLLNSDLENAQNIGSTSSGPRRNPNQPVP